MREVTESGLISEAGLRGIQWLKGQGYQVAIDDAGAGFSTEQRLQTVRPQVVKLDLEVVKIGG